jgi:hypothetical protein
MMEFFLGSLVSAARWSFWFTAHLCSCDSPPMKEKKNLMAQESAEGNGQLLARAWTAVRRRGRPAAAFASKTAHGDWRM